MLLVDWNRTNEYLALLSFGVTVDTSGLEDKGKEESRVTL
jgi:hypothetical protein